MKNNRRSFLRNTTGISLGILSRKAMPGDIKGGFQTIEKE
jgi:hypothetical protein